MATNSDDYVDAFRTVITNNTFGSLSGSGISASIGQANIANAVQQDKYAAYASSIGQSDSDVLGRFRVSRAENGFVLEYGRSEYAISKKYICADAKELADMFITCLTLSQLEK
jgi:hypothetical protein